MSDLESCEKEDIDKIEIVQRSYTAIIRGFEEVDYHKLLGMLKYIHFRKEKRDSLLSMHGNRLRAKNATY